MSTTYRLFLIIIVLVILLAVIGFVFYKFDYAEKFRDAYFKMTEKIQTVGSVTVNRDVDKIKITEIDEPFWDTKTISQVIGKAYKIDQLKSDGRPVHVEFAYNPKDVPMSVLPADLRLFKWHEENGKKYWAMIPSKVDEAKQVITADLASFSILAIRAPVRAYLTSTEISEIERKLKDIQENPPRFTCGMLITMQEELVTDEFDYQRAGDEDIVERHGCRENGSVEPRDAFFQFSRQQDGKSFIYVANALVVWQIDPQESITVEGFVVDESGRAVEGAAVIAQKTNYDSWEKKVTTNKSGHYNMKIHSGEYTIRAIPKDSKCAGASISGQFCYRGDLSEEPFTQSYWRKDLTVKKCGKYELTITSKIVVTTPVPGLAPSIDINEVHGSVVVLAPQDQISGGTGDIIIDKMISGVARGAECKQINPFQYTFKILEVNNSTPSQDKKGIRLSLDFNDEQNWPTAESHINFMMVDSISPAAIAEAKIGNTYECDYVWNNTNGAYITTNEWLDDFLEMHSDEGGRSGIIEINDWEVINDNGIFARKVYKQEKNLYGSPASAVEETIFELKTVN